MEQGTGGPPPGAAVLSAVSLVKPSVELHAANETDLAGIADEQREALRRREGDAELIAELRAEGFQGRRYARFEAELAAYALEVFQAWLFTGHIFVLSASRGRALAPSDWEHRQLRDRQYRVDLACMTVAQALRTFKRKAMVQGGWTEEGGATLTTYFMGATIYAFPNVLRDQRAARAREIRDVETSQAMHDRSRKVLTDMILDGDAAEIGFDPSIEVVSRAAVNEMLGQMSDREAAILALHLDGYKHAEVAEIVGSVSAEAVEGVLYRWRKREQRKRENRV